MYKNFDLTQDFPNKISFHFLWVKMLPKNLPKIFRWPEMCPLGKILALDFQMAAFTKILGRRDKSVVPLLSMYLKYDKNAHSMYGCECHAAIAKPAAAVTRVQSPSQEVGSGDNGLGLLCFDLSSAETDFWWPEDEQCRGFASSLHEKCKTPLNKNTHGMYGAACDAAIAKLPPL